MSNKCCNDCQCNKDEELANPVVAMAIEALARACTGGDFKEQIEAAKTLLNYERGY